jgi:hypothetical protein
MNFMFEDEVDEVGSDVEAYCPKCKGDTTHVVISKYEDEIRRVQCNPCGDVHSYRKPRGDAEDDVPEPIAARKRALLKKLTWQEFFDKHKDKDGKPYEFREHYKDNQIVSHPKFGKGFVSEVVSDSKVEITFNDGRRILVHNRKDIPGLPLAAEGDGKPTPRAGKGKAVKGKVQAKVQAVQAKVAPAAAKAAVAPKPTPRPPERKPPAQKPAARPQAKAAAKPARTAARSAPKKKVAARKK